MLRETRGMIDFVCRTNHRAGEERLLTDENDGWGGRANNDGYASLQKESEDNPAKFEKRFAEKSRYPSTETIFQDAIFLKY